MSPGELVTTYLVDINLGIRILLGHSFYRDWEDQEQFVKHDPLGNPVDMRHPWNQHTIPAPQKRDFDDKYSWTMSPRWFDGKDHLALDTGGGPIARLWSSDLPRAWQTAESIGTISAYSWYLQGHANGTYASSAHAHIDDLSWAAALDARSAPKSTVKTSDGAQRFVIVTKPGIDSLIVGTSGSDLERVAPHCTSARSLPALMCWITEGMVANMNCTRPASRSFSASAPR